MNGTVLASLSAAPARPVRTGAPRVLVPWVLALGAVLSLALWSTFPNTPVGREHLAKAKAVGPTEVVQVQRVVDGDTVVLTDDRRIRLVGINTPERKCPLYKEATDILRSLIDGQPVILEYDAERTDAFGRTLGYLHRDGVFLNGEIVRRGFAYCYTWQPNTAHREELVVFQREAREHGLGLWALPAPEPEPSYLASTTGHRFHRASCARARRIPSERRIRFASRAEALDAGQNPCSYCGS